jgi:hypothetical protein
VDGIIIGIEMKSRVDKFSMGPVMQDVIINAKCRWWSSDPGNKNAGGLLPCRRLHHARNPQARA